jgi:hypothetical protein
MADTNLYGLAIHKLAIERSMSFSLTSAKKINNPGSRKGLPGLSQRKLITKNTPDRMGRLTGVGLSFLPEGLFDHDLTGLLSLLTS